MGPPTRPYSSKHSHHRRGAGCGGGHSPNGASERPERPPEVLGSNFSTFRRICTPKTDPRAPHPAAVNTFHVRTVRTREGLVARAGNPVARSLGVQNACIAVKFEISRPTRTSPRLKHATQKPTLLRQKIEKRHAPRKPESHEMVVQVVCRTLPHTRNCSRGRSSRPVVHRMLLIEQRSLPRTSVGGWGRRVLDLFVTPVRLEFRLCCVKRPCVR